MALPYPTLPQDDPSLPSLPVPLFSDIDAARGDHLRANNQKAWEDFAAAWDNFDYLDFAARANKNPIVGADRIGVWDSVAGIYKYFTYTQLLALLDARFEPLNVPRDWTAYVPTIAGLGTVSANTAFYRMNGRNVELRGDFLAGTATATTVEISLPVGITSASAALMGTGNTLAGLFVRNVAQPLSMYTLVAASATILTVGVQNGSNEGTASILGTSLMSPGDKGTWQASVPIA